MTITKLSIKFIAIIFYVIYTNLEAKIFYRIDLLHHNFDGYLGVSVFLTIWTISLLSIFVISTIQHRKIRIVIATVYIFLTIPGYSYQLISGAELNYDNLAIMLDAASFAGSAINFYLYDIVESVIVSIIGFFGIVYLPKNFQVFNLEILQSRFLLPVRGLLKFSLIIIPYFILFFLAALRGGYGLDGLPIQYKTPSLFALITISNSIDSGESRNTVNITPIHSSFPGHIVLIVDESVRGDFIDLNNDRGITPSLMQNRSKIINYGITSSSTNCSAGSNFLLRTGANNFDFDNSLLKNPYIWEYAQKAGYRTVYIEAQASEGRPNNLMSLKEKKFIDEYLYAKGGSRFQRDLNSIDLLSDILNRDEPSFIFVVKSGVHFPYETSYPAKEARYKPHMKGGHFVDNLNEIVNSYKNAISWTIDGYFSYLFEQLNFENSVIIYTSDHGQNFLENGSQLTHCSTKNVSFKEAMIPLFVVTENKSVEELFNKNRANNMGRTSHFNIVPTILSLFGFDSKTINESHGHSLFDVVNENRKFISGVVSEYRFTIGKRSEIQWNKFPVSKTQ